MVSNRGVGGSDSGRGRGASRARGARGAHYPTCLTPLAKTQALFVVGPLAFHLQERVDISTSKKRVCGFLEGDRRAGPGAVIVARPDGCVIGKSGEHTLQA